MRTETINVYTIDELKPEAKEKAIEWFRNINDMPMLPEYLNILLDELLDKNKIRVIQNKNLYYSLSYCQGDGVCFVGLFKWKCYTINIKHSGHYYHSNSKEITITTKNGNDAKQEIYDEFENIYKEICREIEKSGYQIIDDENKDETIIENIKANEYEFLGNGER